MDDADINTNAMPIYAVPAMFASVGALLTIVFLIAYGYVAVVWPEHALDTALVQSNLSLQAVEAGLTSHYDAVLPMVSCGSGAMAVRSSKVFDDITSVQQAIRNMGADSAVYTRNVDMTLYRQGCNHDLLLRASVEILDQGEMHVISLENFDAARKPAPAYPAKAAHQG